MQQRLKSLRLPSGRTVAYALSGSGPALIEAQGWLSHLELGWAIPEERRLHGALSSGRTLVRYDRPGCGLSGGDLDHDVIETELQVLDALADAVASGPVDVFGSSFGAPLAPLWAATRPDRCSRLVLYGGWARGQELATPAVRDMSSVLSNTIGGLGSGLLTEIFAPDAGPGLRASIAAYQRQAAPAATAQALLAAAYAIDVSAALPPDQP